MLKIGRKIIISIYGSMFAIVYRISSFVSPAPFWVILATAYLSNLGLFAWQGFQGYFGLLQAEDCAVVLRQSAI